MVPVTLMPPNMAEAMFATPCATSSMFDRCRRPVMPSATLADSRLSMAPRRLKERAVGITAPIWLQPRGGRRGIGNPCGIPPNRVDTVSTGNASNAAATDAPATPISIAGHCGR